MKEIIAFLAIFNLHYPPETVITSSNATFFLAGDIPVIYVRWDMNKPHILLHEACHAAQHAKYKGPARDRKEWIWRERQCMAIENAWLEQ